MGAWGADSFENDDALDWLADFCDDPEENVILAALRQVADAGDGDYLEATDCLAASHIKPDEHLVETALRALARVRSNSELKELWDESGDAAEWNEALSDLESRLRR